MDNYKGELYFYYALKILDGVHGHNPIPCYRPLLDNMFKITYENGEYQLISYSHESPRISIYNIKDPFSELWRIFNHLRAK